MKNIGFIHTDKFKHNAISLIIPVDMEENITGYNVLAQVLKRGTQRHRTSSEISRALQEMYGSVMDINLSKRGNKLFLTFYIHFLDNRFTLYHEDLWSPAIALLREVLYEPLLAEGAFLPDFVEQEMENHRLYIEAQYDDKSQYSMNRVIELGLQDAYRFPEYGTLEELEKLDGPKLFKLWEDLLSKSAFAYAAGHIKDPEEIRKQLMTLPILKDTGHTDLMEQQAPRFNKAAERHVESMRVNQGKMALLYETGIDVFQGDYPALVVFNSIYGGGAHSKLFNEVREKHSLCYYVFSTFDKFKGVLTVASGVDVKNFEKTKDLIDLELKKMAVGDFTPEEMHTAKKKLASSLESLEDSMYSMIHYLSSLRVFGIQDDLEQIIEKIQDVDRERVMAAAKGIRFITSHYITKEDADA